MENQWILGIGGSSSDDVFLFKARGTEAEIKNILRYLAMEEVAAANEGEFEYTSDVMEKDGLYLYNQFNSWHTDYVARLMSEVSTLTIADLKEE